MRGVFLQDIFRGKVDNKEIESVKTLDEFFIITSV